LALAVEVDELEQPAIARTASSGTTVAGLRFNGKSFRQGRRVAGPGRGRQHTPATRGKPEAGRWPGRRHGVDGSAGSGSASREAWTRFSSQPPRASEPGTPCTAMIKLPSATGVATHGGRKRRVRAKRRAHQRYRGHSAGRHRSHPHNPQSRPRRKCWCPARSCPQRPHGQPSRRYRNSRRHNSANR